MLPNQISDDVIDSMIIRTIYKEIQEDPKIQKLIRSLIVKKGLSTNDSKSNKSKN